MQKCLCTATYIYIDEKAIKAPTKLCTFLSNAQWLADLSNHMPNIIKDGFKEASILDKASYVRICAN